jgi:phosphohistidine swiveling domain-containing protein
MDFQGFSFVESNLKKFLSSKLGPQGAANAFSIFTEPAHNSFAQDQEEALLKLISKFYPKANWRKDVRNKNFEEIEKLYPVFYRKLRRHTEKYAWVYYVYMGPAFTTKQFYEFIQDYLNKQVNPKAKLEGMRKNKIRTKQLKQRLIRQLRPDAFNLVIINLAGKLIWGKPRRKDYQSRSYFHLEKLLREISKRLFISLKQARSAPVDLLKQGLAGKKVRTDIFDLVQNSHICLPGKRGSVTLLYDKKARTYSKKIKRENNAVAHGKFSQLKGTCACAGKAKGKVRIVNFPQDMHKMQYGDILVSSATSPAIVPAIKKAAAIVTDEGGLTCHASIVSRELKIPCVVGTGMATQAFKDGEMVEVDATKGIVKKL